MATIFLGSHVGQSCKQVAVSGYNDLKKIGISLKYFTTNLWW